VAQISRTAHRRFNPESLVKNRKKLKFSEEVRYVGAIQLAAALIRAHFPSTNQLVF
jgi:hypothetical protein